MNKSLPSLDLIRGKLANLNHAQLNALAVAGGVPFPTLMKIRQGVTLDPRLSTVTAILRNIPRRKRVKA